MVNAVWVSGVAGFIMLIAITLAIPDLRAAVQSPNAFQYIVEQSLGRTGTILFWMVNGAIWFCGLSCVTSASRMLFAFARDGGPPASHKLARVSPRFRTPTWAVWTCVAVAFVMGVFPMSILASMSIIAMYASYGLPILLAVLARRQDQCAVGAWNLGRHSQKVGIIAVVWIAFISVLFVLPPNGLAGEAFGGLLLALGAYHFLWARKRFQGPSALKTSAEPAIPSGTIRT
jgi:amino acid transporter